MRTRRDEIRGLEWYARNPEHALDGMKDMNPETRGIYNTILDRIYLTGDRLVDHDHREAAFNNCHVRVYRRVKADLLRLKKITLESADGVVYIRNDRASKEVVRERLIVDQLAVNGSLGGKITAARHGNKPNKNNGGGQANGAAPATANGTHPYHNLKPVPSSDREEAGSARVASAPAPEGARADHAPDIRRHPNSAVRALADAFERDDLAAWVAYKAEIEADGKLFVILAPTEARADLIQSRFGAKLRASFKAYTLRAPDMQDRNFT